jgi:hypothetical protein
MTTVHPSTTSQGAGDEPRRDPAAELRARLGGRIRELRYLAARILDTPVIGPRGQHLTLHEAMAKAKFLTATIELDETRGSPRHRTVSTRLKLISLLSLIVVDFPLMLWLTSSVFNVDWSAPLAEPIYLIVSVVVSILANGGAAAVLYHLGRNQRENKTEQRRLVWRKLPPGSKGTLIAVAFLVSLIAIVMFERVYTEGVLSGLNDLAVLLAILVSFVMMIAASLVFFTAFRDGSPEQDDLAYLTKLIQYHLDIQRGYQDEISRLQQQYDLLSTEFLRDDRSLPPA